MSFPVTPQVEAEKRHHTNAKNYPRPRRYIDVDEILVRSFCCEEHVDECTRIQSPGQTSGVSAKKHKRQGPWTLPL